MRVEEERRIIDDAITEERVPRRVASGRTVLATGQGARGKSYLVLANGDELTRAGEYYFSQTNGNRPARHFDRSAQTVRRGDGDYILDVLGTQEGAAFRPRRDHEAYSSGEAILQG